MGESFPVLNVKILSKVHTRLCIRCSYDMKCLKYLWRNTPFTLGITLRSSHHTSLLLKYCFNELFTLALALYLTRLLVGVQEVWIMPLLMTCFHFGLALQRPGSRDTMIFVGSFQLYCSKVILKKMFQRTKCKILPNSCSELVLNVSCVKVDFVISNTTTNEYFGCCGECYWELKRSFMMVILSRYF